MKIRLIILIAVLSFVYLSLQNSFADTPVLAESKIKNNSGEIVGLASLIEGDEGVNIAVQVHSLSPGVHGIHIHQIGKCNLPDFKSAGGHFNPFSMSHGIKNPKGYHVGDLGNIYIKPDGTGSLLITSYLSTLEQGINSLLKEDGTSIVIHSGPDDLISDPSGNAGKRIACGVIEKLKNTH